MKAVIFSILHSPRVEYIFSTLLAPIGFDEIVFTNNESFYKEITTLKFNYSNRQITDEEIWILPSALLFEKGVCQQEINTLQWNDSTIFFSNDAGDFPFDIFAAAFYLLTRYEEYLPHTKDMYGRYAHTNSLAFQHHFLHLPLINLWLKKLQETITQKFSSTVFRHAAFRFIPTYDIDIAWSYRQKGIARNFGGLVKDILNNKWPLANERIQVLLRKKRDPFDSFEWLHKLHQSNDLQPVYFFLLAQKNKGYDKNILPGKLALKHLIKSHSDKYKIGIHPSWQSGGDVEILKEEIDLLRKITGRNIYQSRQHYIRMTIPETYQKLLPAGITDDYSMGYGSINGFRSSYCLPYKWYDLAMEKTTSLTIHPFCYMDANSFYEQLFTPAQALDEMMHYHKTVKQVNGELITIWHNHFLGSDSLFTGWKEIYESMVATI